MPQWKTFFKDQSIRTRLITWFLLIALIPLGWTTLISYELSKKISLNQTSRHLKNLILRQEKLIDFYFQEKQADARDLMGDPTSLKATSTLTEILFRFGKDSPEYKKAYQQYFEILDFRLKALDYQNLLLVNKNGTVVFSTMPKPSAGEKIHDANINLSLARIFEKSRETLTMEMTSSVLSQDKGTINTFIALPIIHKDGQFVGVAIVELNTTSMYHFLASYNELGALAEWLLAAKLDGNFFVITPGTVQEIQEKLDPNSPFGKFLQDVFSQKRLISIDVDYHGQKSLMAGMQFEKAFNWALITRINQEELLAPIHRLKTLFWLLAITTAIAVILAASHVARKLASPILLLTEKTKTLASGDLSQRIEVTSKDEIGRLGHSFNEMAAQLDHIISHLDYLVAKRTEEYEIQNVKLEQTIKELRQTKDRLITQEKLASLGALTAGIAHEIKNPLNFINNFAELCIQLQTELEQHLHKIAPSLSEEEKGELAGLVATFKLNLSKILEHGKRADSIVYNMLQHSRGTPGEKMLINIHQLLDEYIALSYHGMRAQDSTFNVTIEKQYDSTLPSIQIVPQEISRVFLNLLNNAYYSVSQKKKQQSANSSYQPIVRIVTENQPEGVIIKIWDNGLGIDPEIMPKLFTPFFSTKPAGEGTGLGLSLSYNIVVQGHGGTIAVNSKAGEFAEFIITLPKRL